MACAVADPNVPGAMSAEYVVTSAQSSVPPSKRVDMERAAINPLTARPLQEARPASSVVQTAVTSALGRKLAHARGQHRLDAVSGQMLARVLRTQSRGSHLPTSRALSPEDSLVGPSVVGNSIRRTF